MNSNLKQVGVLDIQGDIQGDIQDDIQGDKQGDIQGNLQGNIQGNIMGDIQVDIQNDIQGVLQCDIQDGMHGFSNMRGQKQCPLTLLQVNSPIGTNCNAVCSCQNLKYQKRSAQPQNPLEEGYSAKGPSLLFLISSYIQQPHCVQTYKS